MFDFSAAWTAVWARLGLPAPAHVLPPLLACYAEPSRHYHTQQHLAECLALCQQMLQLARQPAEVELALWFHDAVYEPRAHDNEQRSADWARSVLLAAGAQVDVADHVHTLIMATRHDAVPSDTDAQLVVDIDLAILAAPAERFAEYERQVRAEYAWVPALVFRHKRRAILRQFLARPALYSTPQLRYRLEQSARANIRLALDA